MECGDVDLLPVQLLRKYIAYAREYVHPQLDEGAKQEINDFYLQMRQSQYSSDSTPITPRQLESLVRLAQVTVSDEIFGDHFHHLFRKKNDFLAVPAHHNNSPN